MRMRDRRSTPISVDDMQNVVITWKASCRKNIEISIDIFVILVVLSAGISASIGTKDPVPTNNNSNSNRNVNYTLSPTPLPIEGNTTDQLPHTTEAPTPSPSNFFLYDAPLDDYCHQLLTRSSLSLEEESWWKSSHRNNALQRSIELVLDVKLLPPPPAATTTAPAPNDEQEQVVWVQDITTAMNHYMTPLLVGCNPSLMSSPSEPPYDNDIDLSTTLIAELNAQDRSAYAISNATVVHGHASPNDNDNNDNTLEVGEIQRVILTIHCLLKGYEDNDWITTRISDILNLQQPESATLVTRLNLTNVLETLSVVQIVPTRAASLKSLLASDLQYLTTSEEERKFMLHPQAFYWLAELDTWKNSAVTSETSYTWMSRYVLAIVFYENVFVGDVVNQTDNGISRFQTWLSSSESVCEWSGLDCNGDGILTRVYLDYDEMTGHMPTELGLLTHLTYLNLFQNSLTGSIPTEIGRLTSLKAVFFAGNLLTGSIPSEIGQLSSLTRLSLPNNNFVGLIPSEIGQLTRLVVVLLSDNKLSGMIPSQIGMLTSATRLGINANALTGSIPAEIRQLTSLTGLFFNENNLSGSIPSDIGMLTSLSELAFDQNSLTGSIPLSIGSLTGLTELHLNANELSGNVPSEMSQLSNLREDRCQISEGNLFNDTSSMPGVCT